MRRWLALSETQKISGSIDFYGCHFMSDEPINSVSDRIFGFRE
jgi:hypothetical protein